MTSDARKGYSLALMREVEAADQSKVAIRFAKLCIAQNIPVATVAMKFGVSRTSVYAWFRGQYTPASGHLEQMQIMLDRAQAESA